MNTYSGDLIRRAVDVGIKHFDTAHLYLNGNSERSIGRVLEETGKRKDVTVATKMRFARDRERNVFISEGNEREPAATVQNLFDQLNVSLERLRSDYLDILYIHSCYSPEMATFEPLMKAMVKAKESGKARFIGVSTHRNVPEVIRAAVDTGIYDVIEISYNYLDERRDETKAANRYAADKGVGIIAMKVMGGNELNQDETVQVNHRAALKWVLSDENVATTIPGMTNFDQLELNLGVMGDLTLTDDEKRELKIASMLRGTLYCQNCRSCIPTCPARVEIPNLMRAFMYSEGYDNAVQAAQTVAELPLNRGIEVCRACDRCLSVCRNGIPVARRVETLLTRGFSGA
jgi:predicted aldo/keto reductase-like oxidoreductase